jgi:predicted metal-binding protein
MEGMDLYDKLCEVDKDVSVHRISDVVFEERVKMNCYYCKHYGRKHTCPPNIPDVNYPEMMAEYRNKVVLLYTECSRAREQIRISTSLRIHKTILLMERLLWNHNYPMAVSFTGGSCKLCSNGCMTDKCCNKAEARIPIEAMGVNVIATLRKIGIDLVFTDKTKITRCGMVLW